MYILNGHTNKDVIVVVDDDDIDIFCLRCVTQSALALLPLEELSFDPTSLPGSGRWERD